MSRHLSIRNISSKSMHAFLNNPANSQTDRQTRAIAFTCSIVGGDNDDDNDDSSDFFSEMKMYRSHWPDVYSGFSAGGGSRS